MLTLSVSLSGPKASAVLGRPIRRRRGVTADQEARAAADQRRVAPVDADAPTVDSPSVYRLASGTRLTDNGLMPLVEAHTGERFGFGNDLAVGIIRMLEVPRPVADLVEAVVSAFDVDRGVVLRDLGQFCRTLVTLGVLEVVEVSPELATDASDNAVSTGFALSA